MSRGVKREVRLNRAFLLIIIANQYRAEGSLQTGLLFLFLSAVMALTGLFGGESDG